MNSQCAEIIFKCISSMDDNGSCNQCINKAKNSNECLNVDRSQFPTDGNCLPRDMENPELENTRHIIQENYCNIREAMISSYPDKCRSIIMEQFKNSKCNAYQLGSIFNNSPNLCGGIPTPKPKPSCTGCTREGGSCFNQNCCCRGLKCVVSGDGKPYGRTIAQCIKKI